MKPNQMFVIIIILLIAVTLSACDKTEKTVEPVNIHILLPDTGNDTFVKIYTDAAENYHKINPQITITIDLVPKFDYTKTIERLQNNEPTDIVPLNIYTVQTAEKEDLLIDLLPLLQSYGSGEISINQRILDTAMNNGQLLILPYAAEPYAVLYNKDFFDSAHIQYPQGDWTWEQFRDISKKIKGSALPYDITTFDLLLGSTGKGLLSPDGTTSVGHLDSAEAVRTLQWLNGYYHDDKLKTAPMDLGGTVDEFYRYQTGMTLVFSSIYTLDNNEAGDRIGVAPLPHFEGGERSNPINLKGFGIAKKSKHPMEAWKFIEYLTLTKNEDSMKFADYYLMTSKSLSKATNQDSDPRKNVFTQELDYSVKGFGDNNLHFSMVWSNEAINTQFLNLFTVKDEDIPAKLHELAFMVDQEMLRLKNSEDDTK